MSDLNKRVLSPAAVPVGAILFIGAVVWSLSRVLLAVDKNQAVVVALLVAVEILVACTVLALVPSIKGRALALGLAAAFLVVAAGGVAGWQVGEHPLEHEATGVGEGATEGEHGGGHEDAIVAIPPGAVEVAAERSAFDTKTIALDASKDESAIAFTNQDPDQHNIAIYTDASASSAIFKGATVAGPNETAIYEFATPAAGAYFFRCDFHPFMNGTVNVN